MGRGGPTKHFQTISDVSIVKLATNCTVHRQHHCFPTLHAPMPTQNRFGTMMTRQRKQFSRLNGFFEGHDQGIDVLCMCTAFTKRSVKHDKTAAIRYASCCIVCRLYKRVHTRIPSKTRLDAPCHLTTEYTVSPTFCDMRVMNRGQKGLSQLRTCTYMRLYCVHRHYVNCVHLVCSSGRGRASIYRLSQKAAAAAKTSGRGENTLV